MKRKKYLYLLIGLALTSSFALTLVDRQDEPKPVTLAEFRKRTDDRNKIVLVYIHAHWCMICAKMQPVINKIDSVYKPSLETVYINTQRDVEVTTEFEIDALPVLMLYVHGTRNWIHVGFISEKDLTAELNKYIPLNANSKGKLN